MDINPNEAALALQTRLSAFEDARCDDSLAAIYEDLLLSLSFEQSPREIEVDWIAHLCFVGPKFQALTWTT